MMGWTKFHCSVTKTPRLRPGGINLCPHHFLGQYRTALGMEAQQLTGLRSSVSGDLVTHLTSIQSRQCGPGSRSAEKSKMHQHGAVEGGHISGLAQEDQEVDFLKNLVVGMPTRMQEVIAREGGMTRY